MLDVSFFSIFLFLAAYETILAQTKQDYEDVLTEIFTTNGYNKKVLPREKPDDPIDIDLSFVLLGINEIDELAEKMTTTGYLIISWTDIGLAWNADSHNRTDHIFVPQDDIWKPDIFLQNGFTKFKELGGSYYYIQVQDKGNPTWMPFEVFESRCSLDTSYYPFDEQKCSISFVIWSHSADEVRILQSATGISYSSEFKTNSVWDIVSVSYSVGLESRESKITFTFHLKRKPLYYVVNIILPVVFLGLLNGLVFVIPADTGEKTGYSVTVFLSLAVFLTIISTILPVNSEKVSLLGIYLLLQVIIGVLVLIITKMQLRLNAKCSSSPVSGIFLNLAKLWRKPCCCRRKMNRSISPSNEMHLVEYELEKHGKELHQIEYMQADDVYSWSDVVNAIDFMGFWCFLVVYTLVTVLMFSFLVM